MLETTDDKIKLALQDKLELYKDGDPIIWSDLWEVVGLSELSELDELDYKNFLMALILELFGFKDLAAEQLFEIRDMWMQVEDMGFTDFDALAFTYDFRIKLLIIFYQFTKHTYKAKVELIYSQLVMLEKQYGWLYRNDYGFQKQMEVKSAIEELWKGIGAYQTEMAAKKEREEKEI